jgi:hypothetical protein
MTKLEGLQPNATFRGILPDCLLTVGGVQWFGSRAPVDRPARSPESTDNRPVPRANRPMQVRACAQPEPRGT